MTKHILTAFIFLLIGSSKMNAQDSTETARDKQLRQVLGMSKSQYKNYDEIIKGYDKRLNVVLKDKKLEKNARGLAIQKILDERRGFLFQQLTEEQRKKLNDYNRKNSPASLDARHQKEMKERLAKRGIKLIKDSTSKKP